MVTKRERNAIEKAAKRYGASAVYLFGSSVNESEKGCDIDLGVKGVKPEHFFKFYGELTKNLPRPVDIIDITKRSLFGDMIRKTGARIYG